MTDKHQQTTTTQNHNDNHIEKYSSNDTTKKQQENNKVSYTCPALDAIYGAGSELKLRQARILVVGAGGVGCELLKNLASISIGHTTVIDLDMIDFSNLNRQFLFRRRHVGNAKATEAANAIMNDMYPRDANLHIDGKLANVKQIEFDVHFFKGFHLVCNALDNLDARRYVNKMCLAAGIPLIDSGSTGYLGQCEVYGSGFECYDCIERPPQKSYAVCTIRSTPEKPVHCVVWAKFLFDLIFGPPNADNVLNDLDNDGTSENSKQNENENENKNAKQNGESIDKHGKENGDETMTTNGHHPETENGHKSKESIRFLESDTAETFIQRLVNRVFIDDINEQRRMESLWTSRPAPEIQDVIKMTSATTTDKDDGSIPNIDTIDIHSQQPWSIQYSSGVLISVVTHIIQKRRQEIGNMKFDKDDRDALLFVCATSNIRSKAYNVELQSPFQVKGIAGNIIHAIATTNAMVAGLVSMEVIRLVTNDNKVEESKKTLISKSVLGSRVCTVLQTDPMRKANKECFVCSTNQVCIELDCEHMTLKDFVCGVCNGEFGIMNPIISIVAGQLHNTVYECGIGLEPEEIEHYEQLSKQLLSQLSITSGAQIVIQDLIQNFKYDLHVKHVDDFKSELQMDKRFALSGGSGSGIDVKIEKGNEKKEKEKEKEKKEEEADDVDEITWVENVDKSRPDWGSIEAKQSESEKASKKRSLDKVIIDCDNVGIDDVQQPDAKRAKNDELTIME